LAQSNHAQLKLSVGAEPLSRLCNEKSRADEDRRPGYPELSKAWLTRGNYAVRRQPLGMTLIGFVSPKRSSRMSVVSKKYNYLV
jgi:hypothetical protein